MHHQLALIDQMRKYNYINSILKYHKCLDQIIRHYNNNNSNNNNTIFPLNYYNDDQNNLVITMIVNLLAKLVHKEEQL